MHLKVARDVASKVLEDIEQLVKSGSDLDEVVDLRDNFVLVTVSAVDRELQEVPASHANEVYGLE
jgi:hypothetical protein